MKRLPFFFALLNLAAWFAWAQPEAPEPPEPIASEEAETAAPENRHRGWHRGTGDRHTVGEDIVVRTNEVAGNLVLFGGSADIQGTVEGDLVMIGGTVKISGEITGGVVVIGGALEVSGNVGRDVVVVLGGADVREGARLERSSVFIGGPFKFAAGAEILGEKVTVPLGNVLPKVQWFKTWLVQGPLLGRLLPFGVTWPWVAAGLSLVFYLLVLVLFPTGVKSTCGALETRPIASLVSGLLAMILAAPLAVVLAITVVGIAAIPFVNLAMLLAGVVGKAAVICFLGRSLGRALGGKFLQAPFAAFIAGAVLLTLVYTIPVLGLLAWGIGSVFGLGAAFVAVGNSWSREEAAQGPPVAVPIQTLRPELGPARPATPPELAASVPSADVLMLARAGFWRRFLAALLDLILLSLLIPLVGPVFIPIAIVYFAVMWTWKGTTIGSIVLGLKVIRTDGRPVTLAVALVRSISSLFSALVLFLGFLWAAWDREKQTWHDKIAGTVVVRVPKNFALI